MRHLGAVVVAEGSLPSISNFSFKKKTVISFFEDGIFSSGTGDISEKGGDPLPKNLHQDIQESARGSYRLSG